MNEYYDFEFRVIDEKLVHGFCYKNAESNGFYIFVQMTSEQSAIANELKANIIKSWLPEPPKGVSDE